MIATVDRLSTDLRWVTELLFPAPEKAGRTTVFRLVEDGHLRLLLPAGSRRAAASAAVRPGGMAGAGAGLRRVAGWLGLRAGLAQRSMRSVSVALNHENQSIHEHLAAALGLDAVTLAVALGPPRPNRKPVLQIFDSSGCVVGYAKVGWNTVTDGLVAHEADFLASVDRSRLEHVELPEVLHHGSWHGHQVVVLSSLVKPRPLGGRVARAPLAAAVSEVASLGEHISVPLAGGPYWSSLLGRTKSLSDRTAAARGRSAIDLLALRHGGADLALGRWHGDWAPWNMASEGGRLRVWDWERTAPHRPVGLDAIHFEAQRIAVGRPIDQSIVSEAIRRCSETLTALGMAEAVRSGLLAAVYPLELHLRYAESLSEHSDTGPVDVPPVPALVTA